MNTPRPPRLSALSMVWLIFVVLVLQVIAAGLLAYQAQETNHVARQTNQLVQYIEEQTSPERQAQQEALLNGVLVRIGCNDAARLQLVIDGLVAQRLIAPIDVITSCKGAADAGS